MDKKTAKEKNKASLIVPNLERVNYITLFYAIILHFCNIIIVTICYNVLDEIFLNITNM